MEERPQGPDNQNRLSPRRRFVRRLGTVGVDMPEQHRPFADAYTEGLFTRQGHLLFGTILPAVGVRLKIRANPEIDENR